MATEEAKAEAKSAAKTDAKSEEKTEGAAPAKKKKKGKGPMIVLVLLLLAGGGGAGWYFTRDSETPPAEDAEQVAEKEKEKEEEQSKAPPVYLPLDPFTVNLASEGANEQFLQVGFSLKVVNNEVEETIKKSIPEIRSHILLLLTSKTASELATKQGKQKLGLDILKIINQSITPPKPQKVAEENSENKDAAKEPQPLVTGVLFNSFIIQ